MPTLIEVQNVTFSYPGEPRPLLSGFSLSLPGGSFVSLIGRNGSGKSTVAKLLNGLLLPQQGRVTVDGLSTGDHASLWDIRQKVQLVFQNPDNQLVGETVEEDIAFGLENLGIPWPKMGQRLDWALDCSRLGPLRCRPVSSLSGGEKQQVALAGVMAMQPLYLILDEATSMLDDEGKEELLGLVRAMRREMGMAVLQITQSLEETLDSDWILVLDEGRIVLEGPPANVYGEIGWSEDLGLLPPAEVLLGQELARAGMAVPLPSLDLAGLAEAICRSS